MAIVKPMPPAPTIRRATADDAAGLAELAERTFRETFAAANDPGDLELHCAESFGVEIQHRELLDAGLVTLLAEASGELVAFAQLRLRAPQASVDGQRPTELYRLYVDSAWHGRGLAPRMMAEVLAAAVEAGCDVVWLGVWENNPRAIAFYRKHGFDVVGDHVFQLGSDPQRDLVMALRVEA